MPFDLECVGQLQRYSHILWNDMTWMDFHCLPGSTFGLQNRLRASLDHLLRCLWHGNWATNKRSALLGHCLATSVPRLWYTCGGRGGDSEQIGGFVGASGGDESLGRNGDLSHGLLPGQIGFAATPVLLASDPGARGNVTSPIENCRDRCVSLPCRSLHVAGNMLIQGCVKTELQSKGTYGSSLKIKIKPSKDVGYCFVCCASCLKQ